MVGILYMLLVDGLADVAEHGALHTDIGLVTQADTDAGGRAAVETLYDMYLPEAHARHAIAAPFVPPATYEGGTQMASVLRIRVATSPEVAEAVVIRSTRASGKRGFQVAKAAIADGNEVGGVLAVKVAIHPILKVAVINPDACRTIDAEVIASVTVISAGTLEGEVA